MASINSKPQRGDTVVPTNSTQVIVQPESINLTFGSQVTSGLTSFLVSIINGSNIIASLNTEGVIGYSIQGNTIRVLGETETLLNFPSASEREIGRVNLVNVLNS